LPRTLSQGSPANFSGEWPVAMVMSVKPHYTLKNNITTVTEKFISP